jgi:glucokinase
MAESSAKQEYVVGVDLGGTKILAGVFDSQINCLGRAKYSTKAQRGPDAVIARIARCIQDATDECDIDLKRVTGIGLGAPGAVNPETGRVIFAPNLGWEDIPLKAELEKQLGIPVFLENDANVCTLGVYETELGGKSRDVVGIFLGTGIGAGLILNGQRHAGFNRAAGEIGHMVLQLDGPKCSCGNRGCFEALASRQAIFRKIQAEIKKGEHTVLTEMLGEELLDMRSGDLRKAIRRGDKLVAEIVEEAADYTGVAVGNVLNLINPEFVVLGGGIIDALEDEMMPIIVKTAKEHALPGIAKGIQIIASKLGDDAGIVGSAVLVAKATK